MEIIKTKGCFCLLSLFLVFVSCTEDVILDELKNADRRLVIEGMLTNLAPEYMKRNGHIVNHFPAGSSVDENNTSAMHNRDIIGNSTAVFWLTRVSLYYSKSLPEGVSGADITIFDESGKGHKVNATSVKGLYTSDFNPIVDKKYKVKVDVDGQTYTSEAKFPKVIKLKGAKFEKTPVVDGFGQSSSSDLGDGGRHIKMSVSFDDLKSDEFMRLDYARGEGGDNTRFMLYRGGVSLITIAKPSPTFFIREGDDITVSLYSIIIGICMSITESFKV